ncbi:MAG: hypothetical protein AAFV49_23260, partial [Pseudomonadota bacterium]
KAFESAEDDRPTVFLAYTIKGWGTPLAGHKDNHAGLMTPKQMEGFQAAMGVAPGAEWEPLAAVENPQALRQFLSQVPFFAEGPRRYAAPRIPTPGPVISEDTVLSTQAGFGKVLEALAKGDSSLAERIVTMSPDVTVSTNLGLEGVCPVLPREGAAAVHPGAEIGADRHVRGHGDDALSEGAVALGERFEDLAEAGLGGEDGVLRDHRAGRGDAGGGVAAGAFREERDPGEE